jgi:MFS family permease
MGNGIQTDLVPVRAGLAHFSKFTISLVMSSYYVGYSLAPFSSRWVVSRLGHVATIAAVAISAGLLIVAHAAFVSAPAWMILRVGLGFMLSTFYVTVESWINDVVDNAQRGRFFSVYIFIQMTAMTAAQQVFGLGDPKTVVLFVVAGSLLASGALPVLLAKGLAPSEAPPEPLSFIKLVRLAPLGAITTALAGIAWTIVVTFGPVYAQDAGLSPAQIGNFMGAGMLGGLILQYPLGWLSDVIGRRPTIAVMGVGATAAALFGLWANGQGLVVKDIAMFFIGGLGFTFYAIAVAQTNDSIAPQNRVAAAAGLVLLFGLGSILGPLLSGQALTLLGPSGFFMLLAAVTSAILAAAAIAR